MNSLLFLIIVVCVIAAIAAVAVTIPSVTAWLSRKPSRRERDLERTQDEIRELAYQYRDVDQGLAEAIIAKITDFNRKELS